ncbi:MAG TPA: hypothetical protein VL688_01835 [Verrucomicrobiae bacterium]|jgi:hypothetical protein|nr:hypothetical protein [Verrucomicrobiae bacterium]
MPVRCPKCGKQHDAAKFESETKLNCECGFQLDVSFLETLEDFLRFSESEEERHKALEIQRGAEDICRMILDDGCPDVDIEIARVQLREKVEALFPQQMGTYQMIYEARFNRLWEQFRGKGS